MKTIKTTPTEGFNSETNNNTNPNNGGQKMNKKRINPNKLTYEQIEEMENNIVKRGTYLCHSGVEIRYKVSELDVLNREIQPIGLSNNDPVHPIELMLLLRNVYGEYPENKLLKNYFTIIRN
jgi:hypothetical protein